MKIKLSLIISRKFIRKIIIKSDDAQNFSELVE
jgi:hypothetical protein